MRALSALAAVILVAAGCSDDTGGSTGTSTTSTTTSVPTTLPTTTTTPATSTTTATTTTTIPTPTPVDQTVFVSVDATLAGWWDGSSWASPDPGGAVVPAVDGVVMRSVESLPDRTAGPPTADCMPESGQVFWQIAGMDGVRASGGHDLRPRALQEIGAAPAHIEAVRSVLTDGGVDASVPVEITRVIRLDVEGDGVDEVLIEAVRLPDQSRLGNIEEGHYSILVLRRVLADDSVENITLHAGLADLELAGQYVLRVDIAEPVDVNGDGSFELAARWSYYEGGGVSLFDLGPVPSEVLVAGCGV